MIILDGVTSIASNAIYDCGSLKTIYFGGTEEQRKKFAISSSLPEGVEIKYI